MTGFGLIFIIVNGQTICPSGHTGSLRKDVQLNIRFPNSTKLLQSIFCHFFLKKMGQSQPLFVYFHSFHIPIQVANIDST